ncbi:MAG: hypothetical protein EOO43_26375, partial [Flavobacterium sp.]
MKIVLQAISIFLMIAIIGCSKKEDDIAPPEEIYTKFPPPDWKVDESGKYPFSMTAAVTIPAKLQLQMNDNDQIAAFINEECRGKGVKIKVDSVDVFFILVRGLADEQKKITFKYYSAKSSYIYQ